MLLARMIPTLPRSSDQTLPRPPVFFIATIMSAMPARHRERYSSAPQKLSTITQDFRARCAGIGACKIFFAVTTASC
jgi:hypothetical protein